MNTLIVSENTLRVWKILESHKNEIITIQQIAKEAGIHQPKVVGAINALVLKNLVVKDKKKILLSTSTFVDILPTTQLKNRIIHSTSNLQVKTREWTSYDLEYWKSYGISKEWLQFGNIYQPRQPSIAA